MNVLVCKTSVTRPARIQSLGRGLRAFRCGNCDLEDCDHGLRVETCARDGPRTVTLVAGHGFGHEELPD